MHGNGWFWTEKAAEGESFDFFGDEVTEREACFCCYGTGVDYGETCCSCGGLGWVPVERDTETA
ncbi:hypothetical protein UFOVP787_85 [uncultured Caudovirales phage]|uniref:Uncharacterized protein n=1 Tax=uncultured Caudovirales phage TaxID=2100421 RepID=A0A6J5NTE1_9CAUD|nr:hypothetical protein UFOVP787_85 [uncultured Caudovirales phage]